LFGSNTKNGTLYTVLAYLSPLPELGVGETLSLRLLERLLLDPPTSTTLQSKEPSGPMATFRTWASLFDIGKQPLKLTNTY
jgi:hypothetical protein